MKKIPIKGKKRHLPWLTETEWSLMKKRDHALKTALKSGLPTDLMVFKGLRNKVVIALRRAKATFFTNILTQAKGNSQLMWKHINNITKKGDTAPKHLEIRVNNILTHDEETIAAAFNEFFRDSVMELATTFGDRAGVITPPDHAHPVFSLTDAAVTLMRFYTRILSVWGSLLHLLHCSRCETQKRGDTAEEPSSPIVSVFIL